MRTLLIRPGAIGDCIMHFPWMESLRGDYTEVWISSPVVPLVLFAESVRALAGTGIDLLGLPGLEAPRPLLDRLAQFDRIYSWYGTQREEFRFAVAAYPFTFYPALPSSPLAGIPRIGLAGPHHGATIIHPFSGSPKKNWPLENFRALAERLGPNVEWTAGPEEELAEARRFSDLASLARWISGAQLYIGNDSGITHLAAAVGTAVVALFGPTDPAIWCPRDDRVRAVRFGSVDEVAACCGVQ